MSRLIDEFAQAVVASRTYAMPSSVANDAKWAEWSDSVYQAAGHLAEAGVRRQREERASALAAQGDVVLVRSLAEGVLEALSDANVALETEDPETAYGAKSSIDSVIHSLRRALS